MGRMIDLHMHSLHSDGELIPSELVRRCEAIGYKAIAITDHADLSNIDLIIPRIVKVSEQLNKTQSVTIIPGIEITHVPPSKIPELVKTSRELGARIVVVHGETIAEPVAQGTNRAGIEAGADILAHPGLITERDVEDAVKKGIYLEITSRKGHSLTNGHVAKLGLRMGAKIILNSDAHSPEDIMSEDLARKVCQGAGLPVNYFSTLLSNAMDLINRAMK
jgi:histidinol phosphatase-like PHP family hydrolase